MNRDCVTVVSGLPRSGTSMMMQMLEAGGMEILTDGVRKPDDDNPKGYYELDCVKRLDKETSCLENAPGKAVKIISELVKHMPRKFEYKVIFMLRKMEQILASQKQMLIRRGKPTDTIIDEELAAFFQKSLDNTRNWIKMQPNIDAIYINYNDVLEHPRENAEKTNRFLGGYLKEEEMLRNIDKKLNRQKC